jgi:Carboxypeptidase regulatory-like domain
MNRIFVISLAIAVFCIASFSQTSGAKGKVKSPNGKNLSDVIVTAYLNGVDVKKTNTNEKGEFLINELVDGIYSFTFEKQGFTNAGLKRMQILPSQIRDLGSNLVLKVADNAFYVIIRASVLDQDGRSVRGAKVEISKVTSSGVQKQKTVYTDDAGEAVIRFPEQTSTFRLTAILPKSEPVSDDLIVEGAGLYHKIIKIKVPKKEEPQQP